MIQHLNLFSEVFFLLSNAVAMADIVAAYIVIDIFPQIVKERFFNRESIMHLQI